MIPSWGLRTLRLANNAERRESGSLTPIDPVTGKPGNNVPGDDPYNMSFTRDGSSGLHDLYRRRTCTST